jgi:hypothetical protein|tara:strand:- start:1234 stop:1395 length:162 start_codon:yes stop_codon:yes gene_type:complete
MLCARLKSLPNTLIQATLLRQPDSVPQSLENNCYPSIFYKRVMMLDATFDDYF